MRPPKLTGSALQRVIRRIYRQKGRRRQQETFQRKCRLANKKQDTARGIWWHDDDVFGTRLKSGVYLVHIKDKKGGPHTPTGLPICPGCSHNRGLKTTAKQNALLEGTTYGDYVFDEQEKAQSEAEPEEEVDDDGSGK